MGWDEEGHFYVASELKALEGVCTTVKTFPPGHYYDSREKELKRWYTRDWEHYEAVEHNGADPRVLRAALESAVQRQLMSDVPYGVLLSGGLDSSIISAIAKKFAAKRIETDGKSDAWWPRLHSFAIGLKGAPDLAAARRVAEHLGTVHPRNSLHPARRTGRPARRNLLPGNVRRYDGAGLYPHVSVGPGD